MELEDRGVPGISSRRVKTSLEKIFLKEKKEAVADNTNSSTVPVCIIGIYSQCDVSPIRTPAVYCSTVVDGRLATSQVSRTLGSAVSIFKIFRLSVVVSYPQHYNS